MRTGNEPEALRAVNSFTLLKAEVVNLSVGFVARLKFIHAAKPYVRGLRHDVCSAAGSQAGLS